MLCAGKLVQLSQINRNNTFKVFFLHFFTFKSYFCFINSIKIICLQVRRSEWMHKKCSMPNSVKLKKKSLFLLRDTFRKSEPLNIQNLISIIYKILVFFYVYLSFSLSFSVPMFLPISLWSFSGTQTLQSLYFWVFSCQRCVLRCMDSGLGHIFTLPLTASTAS